MFIPLSESSTVGSHTENGQSHHTSPSKMHSKLYNILKSGSTPSSPTAAHVENAKHSSAYQIFAKNLKDAVAFMHEQEKPTWKCWQCGYVADGECELASHVRHCEHQPDEIVGLPGCPFCPKDEYHSSDWSFPTSLFNMHVNSVHSEVDRLTCGYCLLDMGTPHLEDLICHILMEHKLPWRPSPASLAYLRRDHLPHRVVTCMGCGWCTFVLSASNSVQPPALLQGHLAECPFNGGRVNIVQLSSDMCESEPVLNQLAAECDQLSQTFTQTFPLVRGYPSDSPLDTPKQVNLHYRSDSVTIEPVAVPTDVKPPIAQFRKKPVARKSSSKARTKTPKSVKTRGIASIIPNNMKFDVPITLPPQPTSTLKKQVPACLYVCPLCGDNALASLRQRDEHLQLAHHGELVFPCQVCGLAYPLYIALRRHAALRHNADYDLVRYGPPELLESDPVECPECRLVAFTAPAVLKLHLKEVHQIDPDEHAKLLPQIDTHKTNPIEHSTGTGRRGGRGAKRLPKDSTPKPRAEKRRHKAPSLSRLEILLGQVSGDPAPVGCRLCRTTFDNAKEFTLHLELDHAETEECEQLGCQACGRIFFGAGGRIDLIGHLRVLHQDADQSSALSCPHAERKTTTNKLTADGSAVHIRPCEALFSSPRLRQIHSATSGLEHPSFACPLALELPDCENPDALDLSEQLRAAIMETESVADREGLMILAYCCPNCSRLFAGFQAPVRFASHRLACQVEPRSVTEPVQPPIPTINTTPAPVAESRPPPAPTTTTSGPTTLLESVLREEPRVPIRR